MTGLRRFVALVALSFDLAVAPDVLAADMQVKLERLNQREKQLIEKLEAVRQRERDIQTRLEEVRHRKQSLLDQQEVHKPGSHEATPALPPTP